MGSIAKHIRQSLSMKLSLGILLMAVPIFVVSLGLLYVQSRNYVKKAATDHANSVLNTTIWGNSNHVVASGSQSSLNVNDVVILTAKQTSFYNVCIGDVIKRYGSRITHTIDQSSPTDIIATFEGNGYTGGQDFAYIKVHIIKACTVKINTMTM